MKLENDSADAGSGGDVIALSKLRRLEGVSTLLNSSHGSGTSGGLLELGSARLDTEGTEQLEGTC